MTSLPLVLVADDEPRITKLVSLILHDEGFRVVSAGGGEEALSLAEEVRPDVVLLDETGSLVAHVGDRLVLHGEAATWDANLWQPCRPVVLPRASG